MADADGSSNRWRVRCGGRWTDLRVLVASFWFGVGILTPYNSVINSLNYLGTVDGNAVNTVIPIVYTWTQLPVLFLMVSLGDRLPQSIRVLVPFVVFLGICIVWPPLSIDGAIDAYALMAILAIFGALLQSSLYNFASLISPAAASLLLTGMGGAGVLSSLLRIITLITYQDNGEGAVKVFFYCSAVICAICSAFFVWTMTLPDARRALAEATDPSKVLSCCGLRELEGVVDLHRAGEGDEEEGSLESGHSVNAMPSPDVAGNSQEGGGFNDGGNLALPPSAHGGERVTMVLSTKEYEGVHSSPGRSRGLLTKVVRTPVNGKKSRRGSWDGAAAAAAAAATTDRTYTPPVQRGQPRPSPLSSPTSLPALAPENDPLATPQLHGPGARRAVPAQHRSGAALLTLDEDEGGMDAGGFSPAFVGMRRMQGQLDPQIEASGEDVGAHEPWMLALEGSTGDRLVRPGGAGQGKGGSSRALGRRRHQRPVMAADEESGQLVQTFVVRQLLTQWGTPLGPPGDELDMDKSWDRLKAAFHVAGVELLVTFGGYFVSFTVFPAIVIAIPYHGAFGTDQAFCPFWNVIMLGIFNLFDTVGRKSGQGLQLPHQWMGIFCTVRLVTLVVFCYLLLAQDLPSGADWVAIINMVVFAITNGYLISTAMSVGNERLQSQYGRSPVTETGAFAFSLLSNIGMACGSLAALGLFAVLKAIGTIQPGYCPSTG